MRSSLLLRPTAPLTLALAATALLGACASMGARPMSSPAASAPVGDGVRLVVRNQSLSDVDVYAVDVGLRFRVGSVFAGDSAALRVGPQHFADGTLRVIALPIGGSGRASTGPVSVRAGQTVEFNLSPELAASAVFVR